MQKIHLDTDFLVYALSTRGNERSQLESWIAEGVLVRMSAIAWYEFCRGPRTPEQLALARLFLGDLGVVAFTEAVAELSAERFRALGSPRRRAADIAIAMTAVADGAALATLNAQDFTGIPDLTLLPASC